MTEMSLDKHENPAATWSTDETTEKTKSAYQIRGLHQSFENLGYDRLVQWVAEIAYLDRSDPQLIFQEFCSPGKSPSCKLHHLYYFSYLSVISASPLNSTATMLHSNPHSQSQLFGITAVYQNVRSVASSWCISTVQELWLYLDVANSLLLVGNQKLHRQDRVSKKRTEGGVATNIITNRPMKSEFICTYYLDGADYLEIQCRPGFS